MRPIPTGIRQKLGFCALIIVLLPAPAFSDDLLAVIERSARAVKLRPSLVLALIYVESRGKPTALNFNLPNKVFISKFPPDVEASLRELWAMPTSNVDVGLMQVNCKFWCKGLGVSKEELLKPDVNIAAGTAILAHHIAKDGNYWGVGHYHSYTPDKAKLYADTVLKVEKIIAERWPELQNP
jgi:soluble lytic murein transglycosylase-like protein